jgi:hypothetical protein
MYQLRKCETYSVTRQTAVATLDPEKFRNISVPYEGDSEEEFVKYIAGLDFYEINSELDEETANELDKFYDMADWEDWYNSAWDGEETWLEIGEANPEYRRTGGFEARHSTHESNGF